MENEKTPRLSLVKGIGKVATAVGTNRIIGNACKTFGVTMVENPSLFGTGCVAIATVSISSMIACKTVDYFDETFDKVTDYIVDVLEKREEAKAAETA